MATWAFLGLSDMVQEEYWRNTQIGTCLKIDMVTWVFFKKKIKNENYGIKCIEKGKICRGAPYV